MAGFSRSHHIFLLQVLNFTEVIEIAQILHHVLLWHVGSIADVAISKRPLLFTVWTQLRLRSHQIFKEIFTHKQFLPTVMRKRSCTSAGNAQAQLHFRDDQQVFGISNISN